MPYYTLGRVDEFPEREMRAFSVGGQEVAVVRLDGAFHAFSNVCTHRQDYLTNGFIANGSVICGFHDATFDLTTGECIAGPAFDPLPIYKLRIEGDEVQRTLGIMILFGVLDRFPRLKLNSAENGTDWLPYYVGRLSRMGRNTSYPTTLSLRPIEYFQRQVYFTYINEQEIVKNRDLVGVDNLMFATDYPHTASTFPKSQEIVERDTASIPEDEKRKLIHDNVLKLFNIPAPVLA